MSLSLKKEGNPAACCTTVSLENIMRSETVQMQNGKYCMIPLIRCRAVKLIETEKRMVIDRECGEGGMGVIIN